MEDNTMIDITEKMVIEYYKQGFSIKKLAEITDTSVIKYLRT
jgi:hypothetical protein